MDNDKPSEEELRAMAKQWEKDADDEWLYWEENPLDEEELAILKASHNIEAIPDLNLPSNEKSIQEQWMEYHESINKMLEDDH